MKRFLSLLAVLLCFAMCTAFIGCEAQPGEKGEQGIQGEKGEQGVQGPQGETGAQGPQGETGAQGPQGEPGKDGVGIEKVEVVDGELIITYTDKTTANLGKLSVLLGEETTDLDFFPLDDGTYAVACGNAKYLSKIVIPQTYNGKAVTAIAEEGFKYCTRLTSIVIPNSVTNIGDYAFKYCTSLTSVTIGNSVTSIGDGAFEDCTNLNAVHITDIAKWCDISYSDYDSNPLYYAKNLYLNGELVTGLVIPEGVTSIGSYAFYGYTRLTSIEIPNSVTSIGDDAFRGCTSLKYNMYDNGNYLGNGENPYLVFVEAKDTYITSCVINESTKFIYSGAFSACGRLTSIVIPDSVTSIGEYAFYYCTSLTSIIIPDSVTSIGDVAFMRCTSLTIYCEAQRKPSGWDDSWNSSNCPVVWGWQGE